MFQIPIRSIHEGPGPWASPGPAPGFARGGVRRALPARLVLLGALALGLLGPATAAAESWYAQRLITGDAPLRVEHLWSEDAKFRSETVIAGRPILTIVSRDRYYIVDRLAGSGVAIRRSKVSIKGDRTRGRPFGNEAKGVMDAGGEHVGRKELGARVCELYRFTGVNGKREICVSADDHKLPIQVETWNRQLGQNAVVRYLDWTRSLPTPADFFEPDPRWELEHVDYDDYRTRSKTEPVGPAPPFYRELLHGDPNE